MIQGNHRNDSPINIIQTSIHAIQAPLTQGLNLRPGSTNIFQPAMAE